MIFSFYWQSRDWPFQYWPLPIDIVFEQNSVNYYVGQIERLTAELDKSKTQGRIREAELMAELKGTG